MTKHLMLVFTDPVEGKEDEYNAWYNDVHLAEVIESPGFVRAQRFEVADMMPGVTDHKYVAVYEMDSDEPESQIKAMMKREMQMTDAIDLKTAKVSLVSQVSEVVEA